MVDRVSLIQELEAVIEPDGSQALIIRDALDKVLYEAVPTLPYQALKDLSENARVDLDVVINLLSSSKAKQLSLKWEPERKLDADVAGHVKRDLLELLHMKRQPYKPVTSSLDEAKEDPSRYVDLVRYTMPTKDCEKLLKRWDKDLTPFPKKRKEIVDRLIALLGGAAPAKKPEATVKVAAETPKTRQPTSRAKKSSPHAKAA